MRSGRIALDTAAAIHKMEKRDLAEGTVGDDASGTGERLVQFFEFGGGTGFKYSARMAPASCVFTNPLMKRTPASMSSQDLTTQFLTTSLSSSLSARL